VRGYVVCIAYCLIDRIERPALKMMMRWELYLWGVWMGQCMYCALYMGYCVCVRVCVCVCGVVVRCVLDVCNCGILGCLGCKGGWIRFLI
jgi:hypothetical protein